MKTKPVSRCSLDDEGKAMSRYSLNDGDKANDEDKADNEHEADDEVEANDEDEACCSLDDETRR